MTSQLPRMQLRRSRPPRRCDPSSDQRHGHRRFHQSARRRSSPCTRLVIVAVSLPHRSTMKVAGLALGGHAVGIPAPTRRYTLSAPLNWPNASPLRERPSARLTRWRHKTQQSVIGAGMALDADATLKLWSSCENGRQRGRRRYRGVGEYGRQHRRQIVRRSSKPFAPRLSSTFVHVHREKCECMTTLMRVSVGENSTGCGVEGVGRRCADRERAAWMPGSTTCMGRN